MMEESKPKEFSTPPGGGNVFPDKSDAAVLDKPPAATLTSLAEASPDEKSAALGPPSDSGKRIAEAADAGNKTILDELCPMCGWHHEDREIVKIEQEDKTGFVVAALSGGKFHKSYSEFGGKLKIVIRSRSYAETEMIGREIQRWRDKTQTPSANMIWIKTWTYNMLVGLESVEAEGRATVNYPTIGTDEVKGDEDSALALAEKRILADWSEMQYSVIQGVSRHFDQVVQHLTLRAHDSDFWKEAATPA